MAVGIAAAGLLLAGAASAAAVSPSPGIYQGTVNGTPTTRGHNEGEGYFKFANGTLKPARPEYAFAGIVAPSWFGERDFHTCNNAYNAEFDSTFRIPVNNGAFDKTGLSHLGNTVRRIEMKGAWVSPKKVRGFTRIRMKNGCLSDKLHWTMTTPPPQ